MTASFSHLKRRKLGWYVQVAIPREHQAALQRKTIVRSLQTRDEIEAHRRKHAVIADIFSEIQQASAVAPATAVVQKTPEDLLQAALQERAAVVAGGQNPEHAEAAFDAALDDYLDQQGALHGLGAEGHPRIPAASEAVIRRAHGALRGRPDLSLSHNASAYLQEQARRLTAQTIADKRKRLDAFLDWFGSERECSEVTRRVAGVYVTEVIQKRTQKTPAGDLVPLSAVTLGKEVSDLRAFFHWLELRGKLDSNPFYRMASTVKGSSRGKAAARRPWKSAELSKVLHGINPNDPLWSLTAIAAFTGMRREEVATLDVQSIEGKALLVEEGKTGAATRRVPIHSAIAPLLKRLAKTSSDGYLIPGLLRGGPDQKRGWLLGKRFGHAIRQLGIADLQLDFHAFRNTVVTQLEEKGVPVPTIQLIVGHERQGVTLGIYSGGVSDSVKRAALQKVSFGKLDAFVAEAGATVTVRASARPRKRKAKE